MHIFVRKKAPLFLVHLLNAVFFLCFTEDKEEKKKEESEEESDDDMGFGLFD